MRTELTDHAYTDRIPSTLRVIAFVEFMTPQDIHDACAPFRAFMVNKPNAPDHAAYMARAAERYPNLPAGAAQNALHCLETMGAGYAKRYAANASARHLGHERALMGTTLGAWRAKRAEMLKPVKREGVISDKRRKEYMAANARMAAHIAATRPAYERQQYRQRMANEARYRAALRAADRAAAARIAAQPQPVAA